MKKGYFALFAALLVGGILTACQEKGQLVVTKVETHKDVTVTVRTSPILSNFTPYKSTDFKMYEENGSTSTVQLTALLYLDGSLVEQKTASQADFSGESQFTLNLEIGSSYELVVIANCVLGSKKAYTISSPNSLSTLTVTQEGENSYSSLWSVMGYGTCRLTTDKLSETLNLNPGTALVYLSWVDIHAQDKGSTPEIIYGDYNASAKNVWGNQYDWTITVKKGNTEGTVLIENIFPYFTAGGWSYNSLQGTVSGNTIVIPKGQKLGLSTDTGEVVFEGAYEDGEYLVFTDLVLEIGAGTLTTKDYFGALVLAGDGWYELWGPGLVFTSPNAGHGAVDTYVIAYHNDDIMSFAGSLSPTYSTSLSQTENHSRSFKPASYPSSKSIYTFINLFPGSFNLFGRTWVGSKSTDYSLQTFTVKEGHQYVVTFDCKSLKVTAAEGMIVQ